MTTLGKRRDGWTTGAAIAAALVFVGAFVVRGIAGRAPVEATDRPRAPDELAAPLQLLGPSAYLRAGELTPRIRESLREEWIDVQKFTARLATCPTTTDWLTTPAGLRFEQLVDELRRGSREEALAGLYLVFELAHRSEWAPGLMSRTQHANRLAGLLQDWLRVWSERAAEDSLLADPAVATTLVYAMLMKRVSQPLMIGGDDAALERAKRFLSDLLYDTHGQSTKLCGLLRTRHPGGLDALGGKRDVLGGFASACEKAFPRLDGECGR